MARRRKTWYAILGLLAWKPMSGYDIKKLVEIGLSHFWSESYGQLFPTLGRLEEEGLVTRESDRDRGRRTRYIFTITDRGREEFLSWMAARSEPARVRNEIQLKFFLSSHQEVTESLRLLDEYRVQLQDRIEEYVESETVLARAAESGELPDEVEALVGDSHKEGEKNDRRHEALVFLLTLRHGIATLRARLEWCREATRALRRFEAKEGG